MQTWRLSLQDGFMLEGDTRRNATFLLGLMVGRRRNERSDLLADGLEFGGGAGSKGHHDLDPAGTETDLNTRPHIY